MTKRDRRFILWAADALLARGVAGAVALVIVAPRASGHTLLPADAAPIKTTTGSPVASSPNDYAVIYQRNLQAPLVDAAPIKTAVTAVEAAGPNLTVTGTVTERGNCYAMIRTAGGAVRLAGVGETVDGAKVTAITERSVTVDFLGRVITLTVVADGARR